MRHALPNLIAVVVASAGLEKFTSSLSDLVAYEMTYSGRVSATGAVGGEVAAFVAELRGLGWLPAVA